MGKKKCRVFLLILWATAVFLFCACGSSDGCGGQDAEVREGDANALKLANEVASALPTILTQRALRVVEKEERTIRESLVTAREKAEADYKARRERRERGVVPPERSKLRIARDYMGELHPFRHESMIAEFYGVERPQERIPFFVRDGEYTPAAHALLNVLGQVDDHALDVKEYGAGNLPELGARLGRMHQTFLKPDHLLLNVNELKALVHALETPLHIGEKEFSPKQISAMPRQQQIETVVNAMCDIENTPLPRIAAMCRREVEHRREYVALGRTLEYALADRWLVYAEIMKYGNLEKFSDEERKKYATQDNPNDIHPKYHDRIIEGRLWAASEKMYQNGSQESVYACLDLLVPKHEQYEKLQKVRERYRSIVENGGWETIPPDRMFPGGHAPLVKNLKNRLSIEGYYTGNIDDAYDKPLADAIRKYQKHHQLEETGEVGEVFWRSLNVSADQRLAEIEVNIRRWHKTMYEARDRYIYINIPAFEVELWDKKQRVSVHKTIVGNSTKICNTRTQEWELMNSTRLMHAHMTYLVFNPYWNVPPRIEVDEYYKKMQEDPKWLEKSDFEYFTPKGGGRVLRQKPGPNNALGKVKLIFPNRYNTYLHDTPKQEMFQYPVRAFSHGCIRVEGAFKFAREVLQVDGQWDEREVERYMKRSTEHPVELKKPIDVFIEYHTVTVDDDGDAFFFADVYKIIRDEINPPTALQRRCNPATDRTSQYRSGGDDTGP